MIVNSQQIGKDWITVAAGGSFTCPECENTDVVLVNSATGVVAADVEKIKQELREFPTKVIYGVCSVCGMEYTFHLVNNELYLEPSEEEK